MVDGGTDDALVFTFMDDTVATTITCTMTLDGAGTNTCDVAISNVISVAVGSEVTVRLVATDDDLSAAGNDAYCIVSGTLANDN